MSEIVLCNWQQIISPPQRHELVAAHGGINVGHGVQLGGQDVAHDDEYLRQNKLGAGKQQPLGLYKIVEVSEPS